MPKTTAKPRPQSNPQAQQPPKPNPALKRLDKLVGTWSLKGRTLGSKDDNINGEVVIEWLLGGFFMQQRGEITFMGVTLHGLEIIGYDDATDDFPSTVYGDMSSVPFAYRWDVRGDTVIHSGLGAKYTGTFSEDGNTLTGGWRPEDGQKSSPENTYDATMIRIK